ncbi:MAG: ATP synthase F1 subunit delta [Candidatus Cloacimonadota bacterium]|nr:ATP synthase F1 subunit delta [Candidatus Cloacimonadota bacterium]
MNTLGNKLVAQRYAKAVFESFENKEQLFDDSKIFMDMFQNNSINEIFTSATLTHSEKFSFIKSIIEMTLAKEIWKSFFELIIDKKRETIVVTIFEEIIDFYYTSKNIMRVQLTLAEEQSKETLQVLSDNLEKILKSSVEIEIDIDKTLIGGFVAKTKSIRVDGSIKNNLIKFKDILKVK